MALSETIDNNKMEIVGPYKAVHMTHTLEQSSKKDGKVTNKIERCTNPDTDLS